MDLQKMLKDKSKMFDLVGNDIGIAIVLSHIDIAEKHFINGQKGDEYLFNDVIYRCNQAFEGSLKEAYKTLANKDGDNLSPYEIEKYLIENNVFHERVMELFKTYRTSWRNPSTHDYKSYFSETEAFLAIVNISSFINILLDNIIEKKAYIKEMENSNETVEQHKSQSLVNDVLNNLLNYSKYVFNSAHGSTIPFITEAELIGRLNAYFEKSDNTITIKREVPITIGNKRSSNYADIIIERENEKILIEVKKYFTNQKVNIENGKEQIFNYMMNSEINKGILFIPSNSENEEITIENENALINGKEYTLYLVYPKKKS
jgi:hypothetical protein